MNTNLKTTEVVAEPGASSRRPNAARLNAQCGTKPTSSIRVPLTPGNRCYLRALRAAELAAWEPLVGLRTAPEAKGNKLSLRAPMIDLAEERRKEFWLYAVITSVSLGAVGYGLWNSFALVQKWQAFEAFVGRWLG